MVIIDPYQELANAIVLQAVEDFRFLLKRLSDDPNDSVALREMQELELDIHTSFFQSLTALDIDKLFSDVKDQFLKQDEDDSDV